MERRCNFLLKAAVCAALSIAGAGAASSKPGRLYTVAQISVAAEARNAVEAKQQAIAAGQQKALRVLLKRLTGFQFHNRLPQLAEAQVEQMIDGFEVRQERNSATAYLATLDFTFHPKPVKDLLNRFGIPYTEEQAPEILLIPAYSEKGGLKAAGRNLWHQAFTRLDLASGLTPVKLAAPRADVTAAMLDNSKMPLFEVMETLKYQFRAQYLVLAAAGTDPGVGSLKMRLIGLDPSGEIRLERSFRIYGGNTGEAAQRAATVALKVLEARWKLTRLASPGPIEAAADLSSVQLSAQFTGLKEWQVIRARLEKIPGVQDVEVKSLHPRGAALKLDFPGGAEGLSRAAGAQGLAVENNAGQWVLRAR